MALKGGSNNFGIVTRFDFTTFEQGDLWAGQVYYPASSATQQFQALYEFVEASSAVYDPRGDAQVILAYVITGTTTLFANSRFLPMLINVIFVNLTAPAFSYTLPEEYPAILRNLTDIQPQFDNTLRITSLADITMQIESGTPNGSRYLFGTATFGNDADFFEELKNMSDTEFAPLVHAYVSGLLVSVVLQPLTAPMLVAGCGKNSLGLCPDAGNLIILDLTIQWTSASDDDLVNSAAQRFVDCAIARAQARGISNRYIYLNYALESQDPIGSYGQDNLNSMRATSLKYDPRQVFQRLVPGGFKLCRERGDKE